jgi:hypothetical protein
MRDLFATFDRSEDTLLFSRTNQSMTMSLAAIDLSLVLPASKNKVLHVVPTVVVGSTLVLRGIYWAHLRNQSSLTIEEDQYSSLCLEMVPHSTRLRIKP